MSSSNPKKQGNSQESATINSAVNDKRLDMFPGSGEIRERIRNLDWASTSVGSIETWPQSLRATIRTLLGSRYPMIGLAIVRHLVEMHGGTVQADSPGLGLGATFGVQLPLMSISYISEGAESIYLTYSPP